MNNSLVMKQNEHYNLNSASQLAVIQKSFDYIQKAVDKHSAHLSRTDTFFIVDYGCAQGANSLVAIRKIVEALQQKYGNDVLKKICTIFNDLPTNEWSTLLRVVAQSPFPNLVSGKSFYEQILPSETVQFGYTSTAIHWLSKTPCSLRQHCSVHGGQTATEEMNLWKIQAAEDYRRFLTHRSNELKKGAVFLCVTLTRNSSDDIGIRPTLDNMYQSAERVLDKDELFKFNLQSYYRNLEEQTDPDLLADLRLEVICAELHLLEHPIYRDYRLKKIDLDQFIQMYTEGVRSWSESSLISCFREDRTKEEQTNVAKIFWNEFRNGIRQKGPEQFQQIPFQSHIILRKLQ